MKNYEVLSRVKDLETRLKDCDFIAEVCIVKGAELPVENALKYFALSSLRRKVKNIQTERD